jgi:hypothetical protein
MDPRDAGEREVSVCLLLRDCKEALCHFVIYVFQSACAIKRPLWFFLVILSVLLLCKLKKILKVVTYYVGTFLNAILIHTCICDMI